MSSKIFGGGTISHSDLTVSNDLTVTNDVAVDTDTLVVDATNDRVGINKASPTVALDVTGAITASGTITGNAFSGDGSSLTNIVSYGTWTPSPVNNGNMTITVNNAGYTRIGSLVRIFFDFSTDTTIVGSLHAKFSGLPFNASNDSAYGGSQVKQHLCPAVGWSESRYWAITSATEVGLYDVGDHTESVWSHFDGTARTFYVNGFYYTTDA